MGHNTCKSMGGVLCVVRRYERAVANGKRLVMQGVTLRSLFRRCIFPKVHCSEKKVYCAEGLLL